MLKKFWLSIITFVLINNFLIIPSQATSADAITLESISAVSTTVLTGENIVMQLEVAVPTGYSWDPLNGTDGRQLPVTLLVCLNTNWNGTRCATGSQSLIADSDTNLNSVSSPGRLVFQIKKIVGNGIYVLYKVVIPQPTTFDDVHTYNRNFPNAIDMWGEPNSILVPTFLNGDVSVVAPTPTPTPSPTVSVTPTPTPSPKVTESVSPTPTPSASETSPPVSRSVSSPPSLISVISSFINPIAIQASGQILKKAPNSNGDLTWQKSKEISVKSKVWKSKASSKASGGSYISTSKHKSKLSLITKGDAFTLRYMTGKKMGRIQINIDGKKLTEFNTQSLSPKSRAKSWIGIGPGKHKIEIIPILGPGQSVGVDAYQTARAF